MEVKEIKNSTFHVHLNIKRYIDPYFPQEDRETTADAKKKTDGAKTKNRSPKTEAKKTNSDAKKSSLCLLMFVRPP